MKNTALEDRVGLIEASLELSELVTITVTCLESCSFLAGGVGVTSRLKTELPLPESGEGMGAGSGEALLPRRIDLLGELTRLLLPHSLLLPPPSENLANTQLYNKCYAGINFADINTIMYIIIDAVYFNALVFDRNCKKRNLDFVMELSARAAT